MKKIILIFYCCIHCLSLSARKGNDTILLSQVFTNGDISLYQSSYLLDSPSVIYDTIKVSFVLINDMGKDTSIFYFEGSNDWFGFFGSPLTNGDSAINKISGRKYFGTVSYINLYCPAQQLRLSANAAYRCTVKWKSDSYVGAKTYIKLIAPDDYYAYNVLAKKILYTNNIITYFFSGAIFFGFFLFLFLFYKSKYSLFGLYAAFLFFQGLYGLVLFDVYTKVGSMFITHFNWDEYITELIVFTGQAIYVQFIIGWLKMKQVSLRLTKIFNLLSLFFIVYAVSFFIIYTFAPQWAGLRIIKNGIRIAGLLFQLFLFYHIFYSIKAPGRWYIFTGNLLLMIFGIIFIFLRSKGVFYNTWVADIDNASWYMLGVLGENLCFTIGMGQHYFEQISEKNKFHIAALTARQLQLETQENNLKDRLRISQDLHDNIGSTLSSISVYSQVAKIYGEKNEQENLEELLEKISTTSNEMVGEMNDIVWAINPLNDSIEKIIQRMDSFARPLAAARNILFIFNIKELAATHQLEMEIRKNFYLIFKEAIANAIKYSGASELTADIHINNNHLILLVKDNGVGFNPESEMQCRTNSLSGNGLRNMYNRAAKLKGELIIESHPGIGTSITLEVPT